MHFVNKTQGRNHGMQSGDGGTQYLRALTSGLRKSQVTGRGWGIRIPVLPGQLRLTHNHQKIILDLSLTASTPVRW